MSDITVALDTTAERVTATIDGVGIVVRYVPGRDLFTHTRDSTATYTEA